MRFVKWNESKCGSFQCSYNDSVRIRIDNFAQIATHLAYGAHTLCVCMTNDLLTQCDDRILEALSHKTRTQHHSMHTTNMDSQSIFTLNDFAYNCVYYTISRVEIKKDPEIWTIHIAFFKLFSLWLSLYGNVVAVIISLCILMFTTVKYLIIKMSSFFFLCTFFLQMLISSTHSFFGCILFGSIDKCCVNECKTKNENATKQLGPWKWLSSWHFIRFIENSQREWKKLAWNQLSGALKCAISMKEKWITFNFNVESFHNTNINGRCAVSTAFCSPYIVISQLS